MFIRKFWLSRGALVFMCLDGPSRLLGSLICFQDSEDGRRIVVEEFRKLKPKWRGEWRKADQEQLQEAVYGRCCKFFWNGPMGEEHERRRGRNAGRDEEEEGDVVIIENAGRGRER